MRLQATRSYPLAADSRVHAGKTNHVLQPAMADHDRAYPPGALPSESAAGSLTACEVEELLAGRG